MNPSTQTVGVDLGVQTAATLSTGETIANPRPYKQAQKRLRRQQRALSRSLRINNPETMAPNGAMKKGVRLVMSNRGRRLQQRIARTHQRIVGIRKNMQHQLTASLVKRFALIAIEDLSVKGMTASAKGTVETLGKNVRQKAGLNRSVLDVGFSEIRRQLGYKAVRTGATIVLVDRWAPTSKACSACGSVRDSVSLSVRDWTCPDCVAHHDRDRNAAINIRTLGLSTVGATGIDAWGPNGSISAGSTVVVTSRVEPRTRLGRVHPTRKSASGGQSTTS